MSDAPAMQTPRTIDAARPYVALGERLGAARRARGWSQAELAKRTESDRAYLSRIEQGERRPGAELMRRLATALGEDVGELARLADHASLDRRLPAPRQGRALAPPAGGSRLPSAHVALGRRLRSLRESGGFTQQAVAVRVGVAPATVGRIERGLIRPSPAILIRMAAVLSVAYADLARLAGYPPSHGPPPGEMHP